VFGEVDFNVKFVNFCGKQGVMLHFFDYYGHYTGSFYPRERFLSGDLVVRQVAHYLDPEKRLDLARRFVEGAFHNMRRLFGKRGDEAFVEEVERGKRALGRARDVGEVMRAEAGVRKAYYQAIARATGWEFGSREIRPPGNPLNALISFGNALVYTAVLKEIYRTPLNPTVSYLHEPSDRRYSLALDLAEVFKPVLSDRLTLQLINRGQIREEHFDRDLNFAYLTEEGRKIFIKAFDEKMEDTVLHRKLRRKVKYRTLIRLDLYRLIKHLLGEKIYQPLKMWW
jgi:CRISPR-associated protein Cas1